MKIAYEDSTGRIIVATKDSDAYWFAGQINTAHTILSVDELAPENQELCIDILATQGKKNSAGEAKYYISGGELYERDGWEEEDND